MKLLIFLYVAGVFCSFVPWVVNWFDGDFGPPGDYRRDEYMAIAFFWPLSLCMVVASGIVELYRRGRADDKTT